jgi:tetratricopeptide (TPR) repeat protein
MKFNKIKIAIAVLLTLTFTQNFSFGAISTDAKLQYNKGVDYYKLGQFEESAQCFKQAIELDPNYIDAYYNLGSLLEYLQQDEAALAVFKQIVLRKPDDYEAVYRTAELSKKVGEYDKARMYLSLIPTDTLLGQKAALLANSLPQTYNPELEQQTPTTENVQNQQAVAQQIQQEQVERYSEIKRENGVYSDITSPTGIAADSFGNLYVAGFSDNTIYKITPDNKKIVYIKDNKIDGPIGIAIDDEGNIYIANYNKNNVLKVDTNSTISEFVSDVKNPYCMYISNGMLFVSSQGSNSVLRLKLGK